MRSPVCVRLCVLPCVGVCVYVHVLWEGSACVFVSLSVHACTVYACVCVCVYVGTYAGIFFVSQREQGKMGKEPMRQKERRQSDS